MKKTIHAAAGAIAMLIIAGFWLATVTSEAFGSVETIACVKSAILKAMFILIPALIVAGGSGASLGKNWKSPLVSRKQTRMKIVAANGLLILLPSAIFLSIKANDGELDLLFYLVQAAELVAGAANLSLLGLNMRDGLQIRNRKAAANPA